MGAKSRGNFRVGLCLKECKNREKKCAECYGFSKYEPLKKDGGLTVRRNE